MPIRDRPETSAAVRSVTPVRTCPRSRIRVSLRLAPCADVARRLLVSLARSDSARCASRKLPSDALRCGETQGLRLRIMNLSTYVDRSRDLPEPFNLSSVQLFPPCGRLYLHRDETIAGLLAVE